MSKKQRLDIEPALWVWDAVAAGAAHNVLHWGAMASRLAAYPTSSERLAQLAEWSKATTLDGTAKPEGVLGFFGCDGIIAAQWCSPILNYALPKLKPLLGAQRAVPVCLVSGAKRCSHAFFAGRRLMTLTERWKNTAQKRRLLKQLEKTDGAKADALRAKIAALPYAGELDVSEEDKNADVLERLADTTRWAVVGLEGPQPVEILQQRESAPFGSRWTRAIDEKEVQKRLLLSLPRPRTTFLEPSLDPSTYFGVHSRYSEADITRSCSAYVEWVPSPNVHIWSGASPWRVGGGGLAVVFMCVDDTLDVAESEEVIKTLRGEAQAWAPYADMCPALKNWHGSVIDNVTPHAEAETLSAEAKAALGIREIETSIETTAPIETSIGKTAPSIETTFSPRLMSAPIESIEKTPSPRAGLDTSASASLFSTPLPPDVEANLELWVTEESRQIWIECFMPLHYKRDSIRARLSAWGIELPATWFPGKLQCAWEWAQKHDPHGLRSKLPKPAVPDALVLLSVERNEYGSSGLRWPLFENTQWYESCRGRAALRTKWDMTGQCRKPEDFLDSKLNWRPQTCWRETMAMYANLLEHDGRD